MTFSNEDVFILVSITAILFFTVGSICGSIRAQHKMAREMIRAPSCSDEELLEFSSKRQAEPTVSIKYTPICRDPDCWTGELCGNCKLGDTTMRIDHWN